ncbi:MAG: large subunit ribosomal protein [Fimbriimonadaceae bacterium]|nr:large subunit ribosomal protein [Fimbriimonadaceae bacterium]
MKDPHLIVVKPHITEKAVAASYGDPNIKNEADLVRKYTFIVAPSANKIEIKSAIEAIYNAGKKQSERINVTSVRTVKLPGKKKRQARATGGYTSDRKKAIVTLAKGQLLEDYGV